MIERSPLQTNPTMSWIDLLIVFFLIGCGFIYLRDVMYWSIGFVGDAPYGDALFWWNSAIHFAQGILQDNPGKGFRPGYFILTGLALPVFGDHFQPYYYYFLLLFLVVVSLFYLALRPLFNRLVSACISCLLVFNPFTAEWLATSTTDSTGLLLNIAALGALLNGLNHGIQKKWLIAFSILFSLATLTRPLMTPFIAVVLLGILLFLKIKLQKRLQLISLILLFFFAPLLSWMAFQKLTIDRWSISANDASPFYAASDPKIQVWTPTMYEPIQRLAAERAHISLASVDDKLLNQTFWIETMHNYSLYINYHLKRILPHFWKITQFSPATATHGTALLRQVFFLSITCGLALIAFLSGLWKRALLLMLIGVSLVNVEIILPCITLAGAFTALRIKKNDARKLSLFFLSSYWLIGMIALYFVGGTCVQPVSSVCILNALGYRLGSQIFFMGDLLAAYFILCLYQFKKPAVRTFLIQLTPTKIPDFILKKSFYLFLIAIMCLNLVGGSIIVSRAYKRLTMPTVPYPSLDPIVKLYNQKEKNHLLTASMYHGGLVIDTTNKPQSLIFTGMTSEFIWNFKGQQRARLAVYAQPNSHPMTMGPNYMLIDIPEHIHSNDWHHLQGAFVVNSTPDKHNAGYVPYYLTAPELRLFVPLTKDKNQFDLTRAIWFPKVSNATQLEANGLLSTPDTNISWSADSGNAPFKRRFFIFPKFGTCSNLRLNLATITQPVRLSFSYALGTNPETLGTNPISYHMMISRMTRGRLKTEHHKIISTPNTLKNFYLNIPINTEWLEVSFTHLSKDTGIWIYEYNLSTMD